VDGTLRAEAADPREVDGFANTTAGSEAGDSPNPRRTH
jgi:hypothetical protein